MSVWGRHLRPNSLQRAVHHTSHASAALELTQRALPVPMLASWLRGRSPIS